MPRRQQSPHIAWPLIVLAAAAVMGGAVTAVRNANDGNNGDRSSPPTTIDRVASEALDDDDGGRVALGPPPATGWRIEYLVTAVTSERHLEVVSVLPPFDARVVVHRGEERDSEVVTERELGLGVLATANLGSQPAVLAPEPAPAGPRPGGILDDAVRLGLAERRERRRVAGRPCQVYRTSGFRDGSVFRAPSGPDDILDLCVDRDGLVLEEWQLFNGGGIRQRVAVRVEAPADIDVDDLRRVPRDRVVPPREGGGSLRPVDPRSRPQGAFFEVGAAPEGFTFVGRYGAVPPQPGFADPAQRGSVFATTVDVFQQGSHLIVVEVGGTLDLSLPFEPEPENPTIDVAAELPQLGQAEIILGIAGGELRALVGDSGRFVKVRGTVSVAELEGVLRSLRPVGDGTGLVFLDE